MTNLEHPSITKANRTGYTTINIQPEHFAIDAMGNEIFRYENYIELGNGDRIVPEGQVAIEYLIEHMGGVYKIAE